METQRFIAGKIMDIEIRLTLTAVKDRQNAQNTRHSAFRHAISYPHILRKPLPLPAFEKVEGYRFVYAAEVSDRRGYEQVICRFSIEG